MDLTINLGIGAWALLIVAGLVFGVIAQFIGQTRTGFEWLIDAIAFVAGGLVASEFVIGWRAITPMWDEMSLIPAALGGLVLGVVVEVVTRIITGGSYTGQQRATPA